VFVGGVPETLGGGVVDDVEVEAGGLFSLYFSISSTIDSGGSLITGLIPAYRGIIKTAAPISNTPAIILRERRTLFIELRLKNR
jgi:hypothetical protein